MNEQALLGLQDRFLRAFSWLRRTAGLRQRDVADAAGWQQPYVARLEDANSPLLRSLERVERYANACGATGLMVFLDRETGEVRRTMALGEAGVAMERPLREALARQRSEPEPAFAAAAATVAVAEEWVGAGHT